MSLQRKKITVKTKRGKTYQRSVMVRGRATLRDRGHVPTKHNLIGFQKGTVSEANRKAAEKAFALIHARHTHGNAPKEYEVGGITNRTKTHEVGYVVARDYGRHVMAANPVTHAKVYQALRGAGVKTGWFGHMRPEVTGHAYATWVGASRPRRFQESNPVNLTRKQQSVASAIFNQEFRQGRGR